MIFTPLLADFVSFVLGTSLFCLSVFLILLILVQRGRGGGLTGALGGPGGQSAFGTKAGDLFTRITSFVALGWIALCAFTVWLYSAPPARIAVEPPATVAPSPADVPAEGVNPTLDLGPATPSGTLAPAVDDSTATDAASSGDPAAADSAPAAADPPAEE